MRARAVAARAAGPVAVVAGLAIAGSLLLPFILRQNAWLEWTSALWLVERQSEAIRDLGHPTFFLHTDVSGAFYPQFLFYGAPLFAVTGGLAIALGSAWAAFIAVLAAASAAAFGGMLWLGRQAGLGLGVATLPALVMLTSPYAVSNLYGRGAFAEIVAVSVVPLALAGILSIVRAERPWLGAAALAASVAAVAGSHNITLVWGSLVCVAVIAVTAWGVGRDGLRAVTPSRAIAGGGALVLGVALAAWALVPGAVYGRDTRAYADSRGYLDGLPQLDRLDVIFSPVLDAPAEIAAVNPTSYYQVPVYVLAWTMAALAVAVWSGRSARVDRRIAAGLSVVLAVLIVLLVASAPWDHMPGVLAAIQFPLRLHAYVVVVVALLTIVALRMLRGERRAVWLATLAAALAVQTVFAENAAWSGPTFYERDIVSADVLPPAFGTFQADMYLLEGGALPRRPAAAALRPSATTLSGDRLVLEGLEPVAERYRTGIVASELVRVEAPWHAVGHDRSGFLVVAAPPGGAERLVAEPASPWPVVLGRALSIAALAFAVVGGGYLLGRGISGRARRA